MFTSNHQAATNVVLLLWSCRALCRARCFLPRLKPSNDRLHSHIKTLTLALSLRVFAALLEITGTQLPDSPGKHLSRDRRGLSLGIHSASQLPRKWCRILVEILACALGLTSRVRTSLILQRGHRCGGCLVRLLPTLTLQPSILHQIPNRQHDLQIRPTTAKNILPRLPWRRN